MKVCLASWCLAAVILLSCLDLGAGHRRLHLGGCEVSLNVHELKGCFSNIRQIIQSQDVEDDIRIVEKSSLQDIQPEEQCCHLRHLIQFYMNQVFKRCHTIDHHLRRTVSVIANSFLSLKKDLGICHAHMTCSCGESSRLKYEVIQSNFEKMNPSSAVTKALGELDVLLDWIDRLD